MRRECFAEVRLVDIAEAAEMEAGSLYYYFESKEVLVEAVIRLGLTSAREAVTVAINSEPSASPAERLRIAIWTFAAAIHGNSNFAGAALKMLGQLPSSIQLQIFQENDDFGVFWDGLFIAAMDNGELRRDFDPRLVRSLVMGGLARSIGWPEAYRNDPTRIANTLWGALFEGLGRARRDLEPGEVAMEFP
jgi:AcrR family transcriptional regulator